MHPSSQGARQCAPRLFPGGWLQRLRRFVWAHREVARLRAELGIAQSNQRELWLLKGQAEAERDRLSHAIAESTKEQAARESELRHQLVVMTAERADLTEAFKLTAAEAERDEIREERDSLRVEARRVPGLIEDQDRLRGERNQAREERDRVAATVRERADRGRVKLCQHGDVEGGSATLCEWCEGYNEGLAYAIVAALTPSPAPPDDTLKCDYCDEQPAAQNNKLHFGDPCNRRFGAEKCPGSLRWMTFLAPDLRAPADPTVHAVGLSIMARLSLVSRFVRVLRQRTATTEADAPGVAMFLVNEVALELSRPGIISERQ